MLVFVTVGSTRFDALVQAALSDHVLTALSKAGYTTAVIQCGNSDFAHAHSIQNGGTLNTQQQNVTVEMYKFKPSLESDYERADLVISHAGSGTILDVLRLGKPLIVVPNPTLLDNHQEELATALEELGHLRSSTVSDLAHTIETFDRSAIVEFPPHDPSRFRRLLDEEMGF
ncbi:glycosyl transferase [Desarmillaria tabescens]|uniref:UDP-N-acetylglucosamine transferase subunit ALG13 n=1 Tax=Armillaria tabescens TaxID=1929756 RepID=A0AA39KEC3_ARMTA|nr:glycosyl transferase [Desarmillaria tabescens]KAK0459599.1 glycosyl transferase [Desarmillaria tabescens]